MDSDEFREAPPAPAGSVAAQAIDPAIDPAIADGGSPRRHAQGYQPS